MIHIRQRLLPVLFLLLAFRLSAQTCPVAAPAKQYFVVSNVEYGEGCDPCAIGSTVEFRLYSNPPMEVCDFVTYTFGDGTPNVSFSAPNRAVRHQFTKPGHYFVSATVSNAKGQETATTGIDVATRLYLQNNKIDGYENNGKVDIPIYRNGSADSVTVTVYTTDTKQPPGGGHYTPKSEQITFAPGEKVKLFTVPIVNPDDENTNWSWSFNVNLKTPLPNGYFVPSFYYDLATVTLSDNDPYPRLGFAQSSVTVSESIGNLNLTVTRTGELTRAFSVQYKVMDNNSPAAVSNGQGTLNFGANETSKVISIPVVNDNALTGDRSVSLRLINPSTFLGSGNLDGVFIRITEDEIPTQASIDDITVAEGDSGTTAATFHVTLNPPVARTTTVTWATQSAAALSGADFPPLSGTLVFAPGEQSKPLIVQIKGDTETETNEIFHVQIKGTDPTIAKAFGACTIVNDDAGFTPGSVEIVRGSTRRLSLVFPHAATGPANIALTSLDPAVSSVPSSVSVSGGESSVSVLVSALAPGHATLQAALPGSLGGKTVSAIVTVTDQPTFVFQPASLELLTGTSATVTLSVLPPLPQEILATLTVDDATVVSAPENSRPGTFTVNALTPGTASITASYVGGVLSAKLPVVVRDALGPKIDAITPASGPTNGGSVVTITGERFNATCTVKFGDVAAASTSFADGTLSATTPPHAPATVDVTVNCGTATDTLPASFTYFTPRRRTTR